MSQNLGQADVMTIFTCYGEVPVNRLREVICASATQFPAGKGPKT